MITASQLRSGMAVRIEGQIYKVLHAEAKAGGGQQGGAIKTKMQSTATGRFLEHNYRPEERIEELELDRQTMQFLYSDAENAVFMNPDTFDQVEIPLATLGSRVRFLQEGMKLPVELFEGHPISLVFPDFVEARVVDTAAPVHAQQDSTWKTAALDNGVHILVPLFIATGEIVRVDTESGRYLERVRERRKTA